MRLNKFLAERIGISRREADDLIASGRVTVDGKIAEFGMQIDDNTKVLVDKKNVAFSHDIKQTSRLCLFKEAPGRYANPV